jgi:C4-dicarboxylate-specific signal transduction histidine kinase
MNFELRAEWPTIVAARASLEQVILNVVANTRDAMPQGGMLAIPAHIFELFST